MIHLITFDDSVMLTLEVLMEERLSLVTTFCGSSLGDNGTSGMVTSLQSK